MPKGSELPQKPKPIYYAAKALSSYFKQNPRPVASSNFTLLPDLTTKIKYLFEKPNALFVSGKTYSSSKLDFSTNASTTQVFIFNKVNEINLETTALTAVSLNPILFAPELNTSNIQIISKDENGAEAAILFSVTGSKIVFNADAGYKYLISKDTVPPQPPMGLTVL